MAEFIDAKKNAWTVEIDGLLLAELKEKAGVDLVQDGLYFVEEREDVLAKALLVICREQREEKKLSERQFAGLLGGDAADSAIAAVRGAAELFFRPKRWSELQSRSNQRRQLNEQYQALAPLLEMLNRQDMPQAMREAVMSAIEERIKAATSSQTSAPASSSASGQGATPLNAAGSSPGSLVEAKSAA